jgi:hypothetical protein
MRTLLIIAIIGSLLTGCLPYIQGGLSIHSTELDAPEIGLDEYLGHIEAGITFENNIEIYTRHTSSITMSERGAGLNEIGISKRITFP